MVLRLLARICAALALLAVSAAGAWAGAGEACACSCLPLTPDETVRAADAIVVGTPVSDRVEGADRIYVFEVDASYKTRVAERIRIRTAAEGPACGPQLTIGTATMVVLHRSLDDANLPTRSWSTSLCASLARLDPMPATAGERLEPIAANDDADQALTRSPWVVGAGALAGVVVIVGGALAVRRYRRTGS
ncbi:hypothetical protein [Gordonia hydrophobica]|uniref:Tissue inhibitor of metalloproteinase n=1 Tax=Gordonia hydrophobica TaxID=40516 RepID=A0ABZ2U2T5_9ACTN|nr:hypothetical protein [Gordonia hydrophobica]MBM7367287.1 hypothetical protein [Gordonia hydrophobica]